jgi:hypothetical protein
MQASLRRKALLASAFAFAFAAASAADEHTRWFEGSDKVFIRQHERFYRIQEPHVHMKLARSSFEAGHRSLAADEIERAAVGFAYFADRTAGEDKRQLDATERELNKLADRVRRGEVDGVGELDSLFADGRRVLAGESLKAPEAAAPPSAQPPAPAAPPTPQ